VAEGRINKVGRGKVTGHDRSERAENEFFGIRQRKIAQPSPGLRKEKLLLRQRGGKKKGGKKEWRSGTERSKKQARYRKKGLQQTTRGGDKLSALGSAPERKEKTESGGKPKRDRRRKKSMAQLGQEGVYDAARGKKEGESRGRRTT